MNKTNDTYLPTYQRTRVDDPLGKFSLLTSP